MSTPLYFPVLAGQSFSVHKKPRFNVGVAQHVTGRETRAPRFVYPMWDFELTFNTLDMQSPGRGAIGAETMQTLAGFFMKCQGKYGTFLYVDPTDNAVTGQTIGSGDGTTTIFTMVRSLGGYVEPVGCVTNVGAIYIDGVSQSSGWSVTAPNTLTFTSAPANGAVITADFTYAFVCRLSDDVADFEEFMTMISACKVLPFQTSRKNVPADATAGPGALPGPFPGPPGVGTGFHVDYSAQLNFLEVVSQTGPTSSSIVTFSCWFRLYSLSSYQQLFYVYGEVLGDALYLSVDTDGAVVVHVGSAVFNVLALTSAAGVVNVGAWHHVFFSANVSGAVGHKIYNLYLDGVNLSPTVTFDAGSPIIYAINGKTFAIPGIISLQRTKVDLYDFWLSYDQYIPPTGLSAFIAAGAPVDLGSNGQTPTGSSPTYFFHDDPTVQGNLGTGDNPSIVGALPPAPPPPP